MKIISFFLLKGDTNEIISGLLPRITIFRGSTLTNLVSGIFFFVISELNLVKFFFFFSSDK